jgi:hypothetical protein
MQQEKLSFENEIFDQLLPWEDIVSSYYYTAAVWQIHSSFFQAV